MRKPMTLFAAAGLCTSLAACNVTDAANTVDQIQKDAVLACSFAPAATTILGLLNTGVQVSQVVNTICDVVTKHGAGEWQYHGVPIKGHFVR